MYTYAGEGELVVADLSEGTMGRWERKREWKQMVSKYTSFVYEDSTTKCTESYRIEPDDRKRK
jgi:hypothetical protein